MPLLRFQFRLFEVFSNLLVSIRIPQSLEGFGFDLPNPFTTQAELPSNLLQRALSVFSDSKAEFENLFLPRRKTTQQLADVESQVLFKQTIIRRKAFLVCNKVF